MQCVHGVLYYLYTYTTRVDTSSPGVLQSIKCNLCGIDNFFYISLSLSPCLFHEPSLSRPVIIFVTYPTTFIFNRVYKPFFRFGRVTAVIVYNSTYLQAIYCTKARPCTHTSALITYMTLYSNK